ncbi:hypothetical protein [Caballeronia sp. dw_276]|uniref:hypothetical protein n=1 Tax=Caballeronia sp. dw_276 TaxID=2719795 RepID=UPI0032119AD0
MMTRDGLRIPVSFISGHGHIEVPVRAMIAGPLDYLAKCVRDRDMFDAVNSALARGSEQLVHELFKADVARSVRR